MKRGGVCLYYKENLLLRHIKTEYFPQCLLCRIAIQNQIGYLVVMLVDFNARSKSCCLDDITTYEGFKIDSLTTAHGLHQIISQPTHLLPTSSTCIDLIFTDQPNLVVNSGVHPSLHKNCHHQITNAN